MESNCGENNSQASTDCDKYTKLVSFPKQNLSPESKHFANNYYFQTHNDSHIQIGHFENQHLKMEKKYIQSAREFTQLYYCQVEPKDVECKAQICIIHGILEHQQKHYDINIFHISYHSQQTNSQIACSLANLGFKVHLIDLAGFGQSGGDQFCEPASHYLQDVVSLIKMICLDSPKQDQQSQNQDQQLPLFLLGFSFGASIIISLLINNPELQISGLICVSPLFQEPIHIPLWQKLIYKLMRQYLGSFICNLNINPTQISLNNFYIKKYFDDFFISDNFTCQLGYAIYDVLDFNARNVSKQFPSINSRLSHPILSINGDLDKISSFQYTNELLRKCSSQDKQIFIAQDGFHDVNQDIISQKLTRIIGTWCLQRLNQDPTKSKIDLQTSFDTKVPHFQVGSPKIYIKCLILLIAVFCIFRRFRKNIILKMLIKKIMFMFK